jgi:hypothetical protein
MVLSTFAYDSEARRMGLAIFLPEVNESEWTYRGEGERLRTGLMQVKTIPKGLGEKIVSERIQHAPQIERLKPVPPPRYIAKSAGASPWSVCSSQRNQRRPGTAKPWNS